MLRGCSAIVMLAAIIGGCAGLSAEQKAVYRSGQEWKLSRAVALTREKNGSAAAQVLGHIVAEPAVPGVTDEARFRLALLRLETEQGEAGIALARKEMESLAREDPGSRWAADASLVAHFLASEQERVRQQQKLQRTNHSLSLENGRLKELNSALVKENWEFRQTLDRLKSVDMELGRGTR